MGPTKTPGGDAVFSVIIPTLQCSDLLIPLLDTYEAHPLVGEIIVINNSPNPLPYGGKKTSVLQMNRNIFVNPAWNLGVSVASYPLLAISNDDISIDPTILDFVSTLLTARDIGMIGGPSPKYHTGADRTRLLPAYRRGDGFGILMFMPRANYVAIPSELKIWAGDDYLFHSQVSRNYVFKGFRVATPGGVTSSRQEFDAQKFNDLRVFVDDFLPNLPFRDQRGADFAVLKLLSRLKRLVRRRNNESAR